jgi:hypothetical protein
MAVTITGAASWSLSGQVPKPIWGICNPLLSVTAGIIIAVSFFDQMMKKRSSALFYQDIPTTKNILDEYANIYAILG